MKNKKNLGALCYIGVICAMLAAPTLLMPLAAARNTQNTENRVLSAFPSFTDEKGKPNTAFFAQLTDWYGDHFGLRNEMVTAYGTLTRTLFHTSAEKDVICGKDNWLFYAQTLSDFTGEATVDEIAFRHMARTLSMMDAYAASKGAKLIFTAAPNKAGIYPAYLPERYPARNTPNNYALLMQELSKTALTVCDLHSVLQQQAQNDPALLYHKLDSHWNGYGAMTAFSALMQTAQHSDGNLPGASCSAVRDFDGDLWKMLSPSVENKDWNIVYDIPQTYTYMGRYRGPDDLTIQTVCSDGDGSLLMFRDSFGRALIPLCSQVYASATYTRDVHVPLYLLETRKADTVIYELVERNLPYLLQYTPKMPAPSAETPTQTVQQQTDALVMQLRPDGAYVHIYGTYDARYARNDRILVTVTQENGEAVSYEAFPCHEAELLGETSVENNGFALYLPSEALQDNAVISVAIVQDGSAYDMGSMSAAQASAS